ncbi:Putative HTH CenpB-type DNA-binding domain, Zinc finger C2H2-type [Colletotrichum destructivum]|uniref:HTH CenpB-type DNA-binding domain, Zinc finger C2H2-type n=1 Tax=Colletotrichum destructivum TaxID=34406 RepID=A0AAX4ICE9_9PEZI|nr:Putative HTH CenpB-type DNA-binding domain, Zinc finger C2H2-type [Colletotrichum destructivum]
MMPNLQSSSAKDAASEPLAPTAENAISNDDAVLGQSETPFPRDNELNGQCSFDCSGLDAFMDFAPDQAEPDSLSGSAAHSMWLEMISDSSIINPCPPTGTSGQAWPPISTTTAPLLRDTNESWLIAGTHNSEDHVSSDFQWALPWLTGRPTDLTDQHGPDIRRTLPRRRSRYRNMQSNRQTVPIPMSASSPTEGLDPMQRWRQSPPQDEPASLAAIRDALTETRHRTEGHGNAVSPTYAHTNSGTSLESGGSSSSVPSAGSAWSATSGASRGRYSSLDRGRRGRIAKKRPNASQKDAKDPRPFKCTFCCDSFKTKYDWARHEKSRHLNLESWICAPRGGSILSTVTGQFHCVYCNAMDPSKEHLDSHNHSACHDRPIRARSFGRKDHLVQHLKVMHKLSEMPQFEDWKAETMDISSRCGFCDRVLLTWSERTGHLANHFRKGMAMKDWKGEHGFSPSVAQHVAHALPPYLIASESLSVEPFSATSQTSKDHFNQISSRSRGAWKGKAEATKDGDGQDAAALQSEAILSSRAATSKAFTEILEQHLKHFVREHLSHGLDPSDEMLRQESRRVIYDCDDEWNQTVADNSEWLARFRRQHGFVPVGNDGRDNAGKDA